MYDESQGVWRTINGAKVFIVNGLSVEQSIKLRKFDAAKSKSIKELEEELAQSIDEALDKTPITPITEEAIQRVPLIEIPGYSKEECAFIANQHKELLQYARDNNDNKEVAFVFRKDLSERKIIKGSENIIDFGYSLTGKGDDLVILHNHPRNKPFSKMDLSVFISEEQIKTLTVVKNNGSVEILTKSVNYTMQKALIFLKRSIKKHDKNIDKAVNHFLLNTGGIIIWKKK